jgi:septal ring factor EnvC (AmiA/AmiB activator)
MTDAKDDVLKVAEYFNGLTLYSPNSQMLPAAMSHVLVTLPLALAMQECIRSMADRLTTLTRERDEAVKRRREIDDEAFDYAEQIETLRTQVAAARKLMAEAAEDIEYMVNAEYHGPNDVHPAMRAKYTRDMEIVTRIDAALTQEDA